MVFEDESLCVPYIEGSAAQMSLSGCHNHRTRSGFGITPFQVLEESLCGLLSWLQGDWGDGIVSLSRRQIAGWSSGSSLGSYPKGRRFDPYSRHFLFHYVFNRMVNKVKSPVTAVAGYVK